MTEKLTHEDTSLMMEKIEACMREGGLTQKMRSNLKQLHARCAAVGSELMMQNAKTTMAMFDEES